jgi:hypothetical protein
MRRRGVRLSADPSAIKQFGRQLSNSPTPFKPPYHHRSEAQSQPAQRLVTRMKQNLPDPEALLTRDETAVALTAAGYPIRSATLGTKATRGGGPPYCRFGTRSLYRWGDAFDWAKGRVAQSRKSVSPDADANGLQQVSGVEPDAAVAA